MTKPRCSDCGRSKAKRTCAGQDGRQLCPVCCARLRSDACEGCVHYRTSEKYRQERKFITMIDPALDDACNDALALAESGRLAQAEERMKALYKEHPDYHMTQYGMGVCCIMREKFEEAAEFFRRAVDIFPYFIEAHFNLGMACLKMVDVPGMIGAFREVIRIGGDPGLVSEAKRRVEDLEQEIKKHYGLNLDAYLKNIGTFQEAFHALEQRKYESAVDLFNRVLSVDPKNVQSWGNLGLAYAGLGKKAKALECLNKALELDPEYELAIVNKMAVEAMEEGETIERRVESVDYYREYGGKNRKSYIAEVLGDDVGL